MKDVSTIIIAEAGVNHNGSIPLAKKLIDIAADAGADYVKFQTFKAKNLVSSSWIKTLGKLSIFSARYFFAAHHPFCDARARATLFHFFALVDPTKLRVEAPMDEHTVLLLVKIFMAAHLSC